MCNPVKIFILLFIILYSFNLNISADTSEDLSNKIQLDIDKAVALALANNLGLDQEKIKQDAKLWNLATSWNTFIPSVTMSGTLSKLNEKMTATELDTEKSTLTNPVYKQVYTDKNYPWSVSANFNLTLNVNAAMGFQVYQTVLDWQSGKVSLDTAKKKLILTVKKSYYNLILLQKSIDIQKGRVENARKLYEQAVINFNNGLVSDYTKLSAQVAYENLKPALAEMINGYNSSLLSFKQMIGLKEEADILFNAKIESEKRDFNAKDLIKKFIYKNLDLMSLKYGIYNLINTRNLAISSLTPTFSLMYTMDPTFQQDALDTNNYPWFKNDSTYMSDNWKQRSGMFGLSVSLPISNLVPFSKQMMQVVGYQFAINQTQKQYEDAKQGIELKIKTIVMGLEKSKQQIDSLKLNVKLANSAYKKAEEAYNAGSKEILEVQNSEIELRNAEFNLLNEEYNYTTNLLDLEYTINDTL